MTTPRPGSLQSRRSSPSSVSHVISNCEEPSALSSSTHPPSKRVRVQHTLLILVHLNLLRRLLKDTLENYHHRTDRQLTGLKTALPAFFGQFGYISNHFLDSSLQAVKVYFHLHTFHTDLEHLPTLVSLASFVGADLQSVFLYTYGTLEIEKFLNYSGIITGLAILEMEPSDIEFLNKPSSLFPRLKQLEVEVFQRSSVSMLLIEALKVNSSVTGVNLGVNSIGAEGARALADVLKVNASITSIDLGGNSIGNEGARALADALKVNASITSIDLGGNSIGDEGARALADVLKVNASITSINLDSNTIRDEGARALADALKVNGSVTSVNLGGNSIGADGARAVADALKVNASVTSISLCNNSIGDEGARALAEALKVKSSVTGVDLRLDSIGDQGAIALAEALKVNASVTSIYLDYNSIGDQGAIALAEALIVNTSVTSVNLGYNSIGDEGVRVLAEALKVSPRLRLEGVSRLNMIN
ncbi:hypothetical protein GEMRC1_005410 [Eukaryota sp. GEM-RC1]